MNITNVKNNYTYFRARLDDVAYSDSYKPHENYNGVSPDEFIVSRLRSRPAALNVLDIGAGQGRNTIPIAQIGHHVTAMEINPKGRECIGQRAIDKNVTKNVSILYANILDKVLLESKADFAFMSHVSQHFNLQELSKVLANISENLKIGGEFVFDALIRRSKKYDGYESLPKALSRKYESLEDIGAASFTEEDILNISEDAHLKMDLKAPFGEISAGRAAYENESLWGGSNLFGTHLGIRRKPVKLTWFVFKK